MEPRSSVSRGGEGPAAAVASGDSTQRLLEAAAAANAAHQAAMTAAMAAAAAAGGRAHERRDGSCEDDGVDAGSDGAVDLSRSGYRETSPEIDVGGGGNDDGDDAPLDLKVGVINNLI